MKIKIYMKSQKNYIFRDSKHMTTIQVKIFI